MARRGRSAQPARRWLFAPLLAALGASVAVCGLLQRGRAATEGAPASQPLLPLANLPAGVLHAQREVSLEFPGAMKGAAVMRKLLSALRPYGINRGNTIYGQSLCSDEINSDPGHLSTLLTRHFGRSFHLGGIGGAPYAGKTGFMAFSHHVPDNGHVLVVFGPHIGFSPDGTAGQFARIGQESTTTSCGAVIAAYNQLKSGGGMPADPQDMMQSWLRLKLKGAVPQVEKSDRPMIDLVFAAYRAIEEEMLTIANTDFGSGHLVLLGGIQINMPYPLPGFFMPLHFSIRAKSLEAKDLMSVFG